ncbi:MAG: uroporphyrinogen decarboxylase family protein [Anaerolineae bacterium]|nr:uroporphyrinogen decarboxylase family protein [Anaerolineae bacterium]
MNAYERMTHRLRGEPVDRLPNFDIMMTFAAHYIGQPLSAYYQDYRVLCEANLAVLQSFSLDIVQAISDPFREAADWGAVIEFPQDGLPISRTPLIADWSDMASLTPPSPYTGRRMMDRLEAIRYFRSQVGSEVPIMGWVEGALAEAADLRGVANLLVDLVQEPERVEDLLERCAAVAIAFAKAQIEAGADIIGLGDAIASQISPKMYQRFALPYEQRIFAAAREMNALARLHICGNTTRLLTLMPASGADVIDVDWMVDMGAAQRAFGKATVCGNFDPVAVMLQGTPEQVYQATLRCMAQGGTRSFSAAGCEIPDGTPHENLRAQAQALRDGTAITITEAR